jgi:2',3'-cyclic-nucleotide 2'-phosphodiesterase (5'-nucleotidase family)
MILTLLLVLCAVTTATAETVYLNILHTNDIHGGIVPRKATFMNPDFPPWIGGGAWIYAYAESVRSRCREDGEHCLLIDVGDIYQGTPTGNYDTGTLVMEWMNLAGYDMMTLGNHDFDDGASNALRLSEMAEFPVICTNFVDISSGEIPSPVVPYVILDFDGVKVAFVGLATPDTYGLVDPEMLEGYIFSDEGEAAARWTAAADSAGADVIVLVSHLGQPPDPERYLERVFEAWEAGEEYTKDFSLNNAELSTILPGIDVIVSGHTHIGFAEPWVNPVTHTVIVQGYANGTGIGHLRLALDTGTGSLIGYDCPYGEEYISLLHDEFGPDPGMHEIIEEYRHLAEAGMDEVVGEALQEIPRGSAEHPLGRLVADAMLAVTGADVALMNRGGIRAAIPRGPVTPRIVYEALPFEEELYLIELTGAELLEILETGMQGRRRDMEIAGFAAYRNQSSPDGSKIEDATVGGEPLDPDEVYTFVTTGYLVQGNVGYEILRGFQSTHAGVSLLDAVVEHISASSPLVPDNMTRIIWIEEPR